MNAAVQVETPPVGARTDIALGAPGTAVAVRDDNWLSIDLPLTEARRDWPTAAEAWRLLLCNAGLPAGLRFALDDKRRVFVRAETALDGSVDPDPSRVRALLGLLLSAARLDKIAARRGTSVAFPASTTGPDRPSATTRSIESTESIAAKQPCGPGPAEITPQPAPDTPGSLERRFADAGWSLAARGDGVPEVLLDGRFGSLFVDVVANAAGTVRAGFDLVDGDARWGGPSCRRACGVFLLRANAALRIARAGAPPARSRRSPRFESLSTGPKSSAIDHAMSALFTAADACAGEYEILRTDDASARLYLSTRSRRHLRRRPAIQKETKS